MKSTKSIVLNKIEADTLRTFLKVNNISYEPSQYGDNIYFSIYCTDLEADRINLFLDTL